MLMQLLPPAVDFVDVSCSILDLVFHSEEAPASQVDMSKNRCSRSSMKKQIPISKFLQTMHLYQWPSFEIIEFGPRFWI
jgi:hypothetical protein